MNNRRACSQRLGQIGRVKFFRVSGTVCDEGVRALRMCRLGTEDFTVQAIYISPFPDGDMYWCFLSSPQLYLYGGCFYLLLDKTHIPLLLATWVAVSQANSSGTDGPRVFSVTVPAVGCSPCLPEIRANHNSINVFLGETRWHEFHSGVIGSLDEESSVFSKPFSIWHKHRRKTAIINSSCVC